MGRWLRFSEPYSVDGVKRVVVRHPTLPDETQQPPLGNMRSPRGFLSALTFKSQALYLLTA